MSKRLVVWGFIFLLILAGLAVVIPGSPLYFTNLVVPKAQYEGKSTREVMKMLDDPDQKVRKGAVFGLGAIGADAPEAVPVLAKILTEDSSGVMRNEAALALTKMAPASKAAVPQLAQALEDQDDFVRMNAANALGKLRADAHQAVPALIKALKDPRNLTNMEAFPYTIQEMVALSLGRASTGTTEGVPALLEALPKAGGEYKMRKAVARALGEVGPQAKDAVPRLRDLLDDNDLDVRDAAEEALQKITGAATPK